MLASEDLASEVIALQRPLIFLDTAALLDIVRAPHRADVQVKVVEAAIALIDDAAADPRRIWVVSTALVLSEFQANRESERLKLSTNLVNLNRSVSRFADIAKIVLPERRIGHLEWLDKLLEERVNGIMDRLVDSLSLFSGTSECILKSHNRLVKALPPASKSKPEFKDCTIFEEFLELVGNLRENRFDQKVVFVTPNHRDYGKPPGFDRIASDLQGVGAEFTGDIAWARAVVTK